MELLFMGIGQQKGSKLAMHRSWLMRPAVSNGSSIRFQKSTSACPRLTFSSL
uniref:hypothetical protein n=1 Tax=Alistipes megaguti TaxID=2364787 RepID=UPI001E4240CC|nr:hypothetical protein [Alistipes megaguti]